MLGVDVYASAEAAQLGKLCMLIAVIDRLTIANVSKNCVPGTLSPTVH